MWNRPLVFALAGSLLAVTVSDALAQRRSDARVAEPRSRRIVQLESTPTAAVRRPRAIGPYVLVGALAGAAATLGAIWYTFEAHPEQECTCGPLTFVPAVVGGATVGGLIGAVVYAARDTRPKR